LLCNANLVENYLGFPGGISGRSLVDKLATQLQLLEIDVIHEEVLTLETVAAGERPVSSHGEVNFVLTTTESVYHSSRVIIASGTSPRKHPADFPVLVEENMFHEVCALLDVSGKTIIIVGAGDAAFDHALALSKSNDVMILNRGTRIRALPLLVERVTQNERINYLEKREIVAINSADDGLKIEITNPDGKTEFINCNHVVFAIGRKPELSFLTDEFITRLDLLTDEKLLYLIGDVKNDSFRQVAIATGEGIKAAMDIALNSVEWSKKE